LALGLFLLIAAIAAFLWFRTYGPGRTGIRAPGAGAVPITVPGDAPSLTAPGSLGSETPDAAAWTVEIASVNSAAGALLRVRQAVDSVPVPTYSPTLPGATSSPWYRLLAGAYPNREAAESLLVALRYRGVVNASGGRVVRAPYAWLVEDGVPPEMSAERLFAYRQQGLPAYALYGSSGLARIYVGAFESEEEARLLKPSFDSLHINATLTARVGSIR
jgi:hypothetical protein